VSDCQIPPGFFINITSAAGVTPETGDMLACPTNITVSGSTFGTYRAGWTLYSDASARDSTGGSTACTPCGAGILSEATDVDESLGGNDTSRLVAGSSFSCWIPAGWGMVPTGVILPDNTLQFAATVCATNTYGVANKTYGLQGTPCKVRSATSRCTPCAAVAYDWNCCSSC
jgi:hypothetical protein